MDQTNVKKRDVLPFEEFVKAHETALKVVMSKENPDPGAHAIKGEDLYVKHDANIYKAAGIPHNEKIADANNLVTANQVDLFSKTNEKDEPTKADKKAADDAAALIGNAHGQVSESSHTKTFESFLNETWTKKLQDNYDSLEDFLEHDEMYDITRRLGHEDPEELWNANPTISGSTNPEDLKIVK